MSSPFIIAEAGVNHNGSVVNALGLVREAKANLASAVKFQSFSAEELTTSQSQKVRYQKINDPTTKSQLDMLSSLELSKEDFRRVFEFGSEIGIEVFSTPYSTKELDFLLSLGVRRIKIASADIVDLELIRAAAETGLPTIVSTGMAEIEEIQAAVELFSKTASNLTLLHATSSYPAPNEHLNLRAIPELKKRFGVKVGYSDHSVGNRASVIAVSLGAEVLERHLTLNKADVGPDHVSSLEPAEFSAYVREIEATTVALGSPDKLPASSELEMRNLARKKILFGRDVVNGQLVTREDLILRRSPEGLSADSVSSVVGKRMRKNKSCFEPVQMEDFR